MDDNNRLRVASAGELTEIVPYLLGFTPQDSMVLMAVDQGRVSVTARADLADVRAPGQVEDLCDRLHRHNPRAHFLALAYTDQADTGWDLLRRVDRHLGAERVAIRLLVAGDTWYDAQGGSGAVDRYGPLAAQAAVQGLRRDNQRSDLAARFQPPELTEELRQTVVAALGSLPSGHEVDDRIRLTHRLIADHAADGGGHLTSYDAARLTTLIQARAGSDLALGMIGRPVGAEQHLALWTRVVQHTPHQLAEEPLHMAAVCAWIVGDGAASNVALELAERINTAPTHTPPRGLLELVNEHVLPPTAWPECREALLSHTHPAVTALLNPSTEDSPHPRWERVDPPSPGSPHTEPPQHPGPAPAGPRL